MENGHKNVRRYGDQYHCHDCGKQWDVDDPECPECRRESAGSQAINDMRKLISEAKK